MISTVDLVKAFINSQHGWAVAEQFEETINQDISFEEMNYNALKYIQQSVYALLKSDVLSEDSESELNEYHDRLKDYLNK